MSDIQYTNLDYKYSDIKHLYGDHVHILSNPYLQTILQKLSLPETKQPQLNKYIDILYKELLQTAVNTLFPRELVRTDTRMKEFNEEGVFSGEILKQNQSAVIVNLARAGTYPSHICFDELNYILHQEGLRQDHFYINRKVNQNNEVIGVDASGSKIGGGQEGSFVIFPDPMGATGGSLSHCISHYKKEVDGTAKKYIALHLIVTPEYIQRMTKDHPDVEIFTIRLDRGLSDQDTLKTKPGTNPEKEKGLNKNQYIVPGAGGVGEILNNSFV